MILCSSFLVVALLQLACAEVPRPYTPWAVRLSYGDNQYELVVTWSTWNATDSIVEYGIEGPFEQAVGEATLFVEPQWNLKQQYIHRVKLSNLQPNSRYRYHAGSHKEWSKEYSFATPPPEDEPWSPRLVLYGDLGYTNAVSLPQLEKEIEAGLHDAIIHIGDFGYDMDQLAGEVGDYFLRQIEPIAARVPYMASPGNHEEFKNFTHYRALFSMPGGTESLMYSFNVGPIHIISISTEFYYFIKYGMKLIAKQYMWLEEDLKEATSAENRTIRPWIFVLGHRPMYCSANDGDDCANHNTRLRIGMPFFGFGLEDLFDKYGVDMAFWAHEHNYERLWPIYNYTMYNGSKEEPYRNPNSMVHITTGSAGNCEDQNYFMDERPAWSAFNTTEYGFTRLKVYNSSHLYMEQVSEAQDWKVIDSIWVIKDYHGPYHRPRMSEK